MACLLVHLLCVATAASGAISLDFGQGVSSFVRPRVTDLLQGVGVADNRTLHITAGISALDLGLGLADEGFAIRFTQNSSGTINAAVESKTTLGLSFGLYALLGELGFGFLHPMYVATPNNASVDLAPLLAMESMARQPKLQIRGSHVHAEHPNELCNMLNGFAADGSFASREKWQLLLSEWAQYLQWLLAQVLSQTCAAPPRVCIITIRTNLCCLHRDRIPLNGPSSPLRHLRSLMSAQSARIG
jgi:hypothetical protein